MEKMNILLIGTYYAPYMVGGAEKMFQIHAKGLAQHGHQVSVATFGPNRKNIEEESLNGVHIFRIPLKNLYWPLDSKPGKIQKVLWHIIDCYNPFHDKALDAIIQKTAPQIVICENIVGWTSAIWSFFASRNIPIIQIVHDSSFLCAFGTMYRKGKRCEKPCIKCKVLTAAYKFQNKHVAQFVFVSKMQKELFEQLHFTKRPSHVICNAENISMENKEIIWDGKRTFELGFIATLSEGKGIINLIKAFKLLKGDMRLSIAGKAVSPQFKNEILEHIGNDPRIQMVGYINSEDFFRKIDLAIVPSIVSESFGLVAIEALAKQVPVVAADRGGLLEIISEGENGLLCNPEDINSIASCIQSLYDNNEIYLKLTKKTHETVRKFTDVNLLIDKIEELCYKEVKQAERK